jgi:hypothetical protein
MDLVLFSPAWANRLFTVISRSQVKSGKIQILCNKRRASLEKLQNNDWGYIGTYWRTSLWIYRGLQSQICRFKNSNYIPLQILLKKFRIWNSRSESVAPYRTQGKSSTACKMGSVEFLFLKWKWLWCYLNLYRIHVTFNLYLLLE